MLNESSDIELTIVDDLYVHVVAVDRDVETARIASVDTGNHQAEHVREGTGFQLDLP